MGRAAVEGVFVGGGWSGRIGSVHLSFVVEWCVEGSGMTAVGGNGRLLVALKKSSS